MSNSKGGKVVVFNPTKVNYQDTIEVCITIIKAYHRGTELGGSFEWADMDDAYVIACRALGLEDLRVEDDDKNK